MDYRFIHPLYTNEDYESARDFLADNMSKKLNFGDGEGPQPDESLKKIIAKNMVTNLYGVNLIRMANIATVQKVVSEKYIPHIVEYLGFCKVDCKVVEVQYQKIIPDVIAYRSKLPSFKPLVQFNPNIEWDLKYTDDIERNLINPLSAMSHYYLSINGVAEYDLARDLDPIYFGGRFKPVIDDWENQRKSLFFSFEILPDDNLHRINILMKSIHKYF